MKKLRLIFAGLCLCACVSCRVENVLSYPRLNAEITAFEVEGQKSVAINTETRTVDIVLTEKVFIDSLVVKNFKYTEDAVLDAELPKVLDLTQPLVINMTTYPDQTYQWTIKATQPIERYIECDNMLEAVFDEQEKTILAYFPEDQELMNIRISKMKLEHKGSVIDSTFGFISTEATPVAINEKVSLPMTLDCVITRKFKVLHENKTFWWSMTAVHKVVEMEITSVNAWCYSADINAVYKGQGTPVIQYKEPADEDWISLHTTVNGMNISASVTQLAEGTDYVARVLNGDALSEEFTFTTETPEQPANMSFDDWYQGDPGGYTWYPNANGGPYVWSNANPGVNMMSAVNSTRPEYDFVVKRGGAAVRMESVKVFGMFAAGNIYTGEFIKAVLTPSAGAQLNWGTPFTTRPASLKGYYCYAPKVIDNASAGYEDKIGTMDRCQILVFLTDWDEQFLISTAEQKFVDLENDPHIIALGRMESDVDTGGKYVEFECPLEYRDLTRKPKYLVIASCSSMYGDYFTGGLGSVMYVDEYEFTYR